MIIPAGGALVLSISSRPCIENKDQSGKGEEGGGGGRTPACERPPVKEDQGLRPLVISPGQQGLEEREEGGQGRLPGIP